MCKEVIQRWGLCLRQKKETRQAITRLLNHRLRTAAFFGQRFLVDLAGLNSRNCRYFAGHLNECITYNKFTAKEPFDLTMFNSSSRLQISEQFHRYLPSASSLTRHLFTDWSYHDVFQQPNLVLLMSTSYNLLDDFNHDDGYVMCPYVSKDQKREIIKIAKYNHIRIKRIPFDQYGVDERLLRLDTIFMVMHHWAATGNWQEAIDRYVVEKKWGSGPGMAYPDDLKKERRGALNSRQLLMERQKRNKRLLIDPDDQLDRLY